MTEKEVVTVIKVQLHWVTAACSASPCRVSTPSNRRHIHFTGAVVPFQAPITADHLPLLLQMTLAKPTFTISVLIVSWRLCQWDAGKWRISPSSRQLYKYLRIFVISKQSSSGRCLLHIAMAKAIAKTPQSDILVYFCRRRKCMVMPDK